MILLYGVGTLAFSITGSQSPAPTLNTDPNYMQDGRTGTVTSINFTGGSQAITVYEKITVGITGGLDTTPIWGGVGVANVVGLPVGTKLTFNGVTQRLAYNELGELGAWWLPTGVTGASKDIFIYNDVGGVTAFAAGTVHAIGEIIVGRVITLPTLLETQIQDGLVDPSAYNRAAGAQLWQNMRKPWREYTQTLGKFTVAQARGKTTSNLPSGGNPQGVIDVATLRGLLVKAPRCAVCDVPSTGFGAGTLSNGFRYDQDFMQAGWMVAKPISPGNVTLDAAPYYSWNPQFQEAL